MKQHLIITVVLSAILSNLSMTVWAQFPEMKKESWYKEKVLGLEAGAAEEVSAEPETETKSVLQQMNQLVRAKKYSEVLDLYAQAKSEYGRNKNVYDYERMALRGLLGENSNSQYLSQLEKVYKDYLNAGNQPDPITYSGVTNGKSWNDVQWMIDYARFSECDGFELRYAKVSAFVGELGEKADPNLVIYGMLMPLTSQHKAQQKALASDSRKGSQFYGMYETIENKLKEIDAYVKGAASSDAYDKYRMSFYIDNCESMKMDLIPYEDYVALHPVSEVQEHAQDAEYLQARINEMGRFSGKPHYKLVNDLFLKLGATYLKYKSMGDSEMRNQQYSSAAEYYRKALELAENDDQQADGNYWLAYANLQNKNFTAAWTAINTAITYQAKSTPLMRNYNMKWNVLYSCASSCGDGIDRIAYYSECLNILAAGRNACDKEGQEKDFADADNHQKSTQSIGRSTWEGAKTMIFMKGLKAGQSYSTQSGAIRISTTLREF